MRLDGKTALVTGSASGIGKATAAALAAQGARLFLADINENDAVKAAGEINRAGGQAEAIGLDVTDRVAIEATALRVHGKAGRLDILVNAAGWDRIEPFMDNTPEFIEKVVALNYLGQVYMAKAFLPPMIEAGRGKIVNVASDAGRVGSTGETVYAGAKGGVIAFTKSLAREMARHNICVNCICPGPTDTPLFQAQPERMKEALLRVIPFRRLARPEDIANAILFFSSDRSSYITGQVLSVSGGLTMSG
ncbi:MAG: glucose 1-dehydrogenase [Alphaproteobacteria bacterium]|nr:glucose 1-dehydrogenase [Alphaproteobacteria bacterium]